MIQKLFTCVYLSSVHDCKLHVPSLQYPCGVMSFTSRSHKFKLKTCWFIMYCIQIFSFVLFLIYGYHLLIENYSHAMTIESVVLFVLFLFLCAFLAATCQGKGCRGYFVRAVYIRALTLNWAFQALDQLQPVECQRCHQCFSSD